MAYTAAHTTTHGLAARLHEVLDGLRTRWARHRDFNRTYGELDRLSNRELADIGVRRCDIADIARVHTYGN